jgi:uncharacterized repeat protein (TIGR01451 family)
MRSRLSFLASGLMLALALAPSPADAACDANNTYGFAFSSVPAASLNYANSYSYTASNPLGATSNFTTSFTTNGLSSNVVNSVALPAIGNLITSGSGANTLVVGGIFSGRTPSITGATRVITIIFTFTQPVRDFSFTVHDADYTSNQFRDWLHISGSNSAATYTPTLSTPYGTNNGAGPRSNASSSLTLGAAAAPFTLSSSEGVGTGASGNNGVTTGDVTASFAQPVTSIIMRYGNYPYQSGESSTGQQGMGISALSFCPMPALAITKTSAPYATSGPDRFNAPGSDVAYALTVTNSGGSPVDLSSLVLTDVLPANVTFYNGDYDAAVPGSGPFQLIAGASGVTLPAGGRAYSNNNGATYVYAPAAGYDANVDAVQLTPSGSVAANSTFTIRFRARID